MTHYDSISYYGSTTYIDSTSSIHWTTGSDRTVGGLDDSYSPGVSGSGKQVEENKKEVTKMIDRQKFLDALVVEGRPVTAEELEIVRESSGKKWELFVAVLLAKAFETVDLEILKEKPKEVLIKEA